MNILRCKPTCFDVLEEDKHGNKHMNPNDRPNKGRAIADWERLSRVDRMLGISDYFIEPEPGFVDMTFTANCGFTFKRADGVKNIILSNFRPERRQKEQDYFERYFRTVLGYSTIRISDMFYFEGAGDAIPFDNAILLGHGFRTSRNMIDQLGDLTGKMIIPLELKKPDEGDKILYHLDTTMIVIDNPSERIIFAYRGAFTDASWALLKYEVEKRAGHLLEATYDDAANLALNAIIVNKSDISLDEKQTYGDEILTRHYEYICNALRNENKDFKGVIITANTASNRLLQDVYAWGYYPITLPLGEFIKAGGGAFCLTKILCD